MKIWVDEVQDFSITCPICRDPHGGHHLSMRHTYTKGCLEYESIYNQLTEYFREDLG